MQLILFGGIGPHTRLYMWKPTTDAGSYRQSLTNDFLAICGPYIMLMKTIFHGPKEKEHSRVNRTEPKFDIEPKFVIPTDFYGSLSSDSNKERRRKQDIDRANESRLHE